MLINYAMTKKIEIIGVITKATFAIEAIFSMIILDARNA